MGLVILLLLLPLCFDRLALLQNACYSFFFFLLYLLDYLGLIGIATSNAYGFST